MFRLLKNADVYAPEHIGKADILLCNDKIVDIAETIQFDYPGTEVVDLEGKIVIPGVIDQHIHITGGGGESGFTSKVTEVGLSDLVRGGVCTVVGVLGTDSLSRNVESVLAKVKALNEEGLTAYCYTGSYDYPSPTITGSVGKDIAFIDEIIGVKICWSDHRYAGITKEEMTKLAAAARVAGLVGKKPGVVHIHMGAGKDGLKGIFQILEETDIPVKTFRPTHASNNLADMMTLAKMGGYADFTTCLGPSKVAEQMKPFLEEAPDGSVTMSSDSNGSMPVWNDKKEVIGIKAAESTTVFETIVALHKEQGLPLEEALKPATVNVAKALNLYPRKGCLKPDSDADLLVLDADLKLYEMYAKGKKMMAEGEPIVKGYFEK
ncbi:MAG: beta-aspartyl-peptidase [Clostridiales bacterium]|nr:beta-aspartyl-peptidase [Clostridiales bacterium]